MFDLKIMKSICTQPFSEFEQFGQVLDTPDGKAIYIDRGAEILAVAHLDTVCPPTHFNYQKNPRKVFTPTLDDRLGATIILDVLPQYRLNYDILLTEGEEQGRSTARYFLPPDGKNYNWMFSFDRGGVDAVYYQYITPEWMTALKDLNVKLDRGLFSDICFLDHLGICGVNVGCAYYAYHSPKAYCLLDETELMVEKFVRFFEQHQHEKFEYNEFEYGYYDECEWCWRPFTPGDRTYDHYSSGGGFYCEDCLKDAVMYDRCEFCKELTEVTSPYAEQVICDECFETLTLNNVLVFGRGQ